MDAAYNNYLRQCWNRREEPVEQSLWWASVPARVPPDTPENRKLFRADLERATLEAGRLAYGTFESWQAWKVHTAYAKARLEDWIINK